MWELTFQGDTNIVANNKIDQVERRGNNLKGFKDFCTGNGSSKGHNLALTGLLVPGSPFRVPLPSEEAKS